MKKLYKFELSCGRMGSLEGVFVATEEEVEEALGKNVYFGEVLGKHSEIFFDLDESMLSVITDDQDFIDKCERFGIDSTGLIQQLRQQSGDLIDVCRGFRCRCCCYRCLCRCAGIGSKIRRGLHSNLGITIIPVGIHNSNVSIQCEFAQVVINFDHLAPLQGFRIFGGKALGR